MSSEFAILSKMRAASIPPYAYETSLSKERLDILAADIKDKSYEMDGKFLQSYALTFDVPNKQTGAKVTKAVAVFCKELVLRNVRVRYFSVAELMIPIRRALATGDYGDSDMEYGKGFLALGDYGANLDNWRKEDVETLNTVLVSHMSRGGGVILGITSPLSASTSNDLMNSLATFKTVKVA